MADKIFSSPRFASNAQLKEVLNNRLLLKRGSLGDAVKLIQQALKDLGDTALPLPDGNFGPQTEAAVRRYQTARSRPVHGPLRLPGAGGFHRAEHDYRSVP